MYASASSDADYMRRCLQLARCAAGSTSPNPMVGAVIVCDGRIIGEGYHIRAGEPHAEVNAVRSVKECDRHLLCRSTMYVTLEPCSHYGKTPPCCDLIISCGIPRVVIAATDANVQVNGGGIARMKAAGIEVITGMLDAESCRLNGAFFSFHQQHRPYVMLKWAQSGNGYIDRVRGSDEPPLQVSTPLSRVSVHKLRAEYDAILVGTRTAMLDNPSLDIRYWAGHSPIRLVIDRKGVLLPGLKLFDGQQRTIVYTEAVCKDKFGKNVEQIALDFSSGIVPQILSHLYSLKVNSLLVEGGAFLLQSFIDSGLWDAARVEVNDRIAAGGGVKAPLIAGGAVAEESLCGGNRVLLYKRP